MRRNHNQLIVDPCVYILLPAVLLIIPIPWLGAWLFAVIVHEMGHYFAIKLTGSEVVHVNVGLHGVVMDTHFLHPWHEVISALMGPVVSFLLICLAEWFPRVAIIGCVQGLYNMLPLYPLDGGRIVRGLAESFLPDRWHVKAEQWTGNICLCILGFLMFKITLKFSLGLIPVLLYVLLLIQCKQIKFPCKRGGEGVQ